MFLVDFAFYGSESPKSLLLGLKELPDNLKVRKCEIGAAGLWWCRLGRISTLQCWHPHAGFFDLLEQREKEWGSLEISGSDLEFANCLESNGTVPVRSTGKITTNTETRAGLFFPRFSENLKNSLWRF